MTESSDLRGQTLGSCVLERVVGRGGMSTVYLARQKRPARQVAVKVLQPHYRTGKEAYLRRFQREADIVAQLEHPNIIPLYEYGEQDTLTYFVMPYVSGGSLENLLEQEGAVSVQKADFYLSQTAQALDYAHTHNVIHRDLKPSNLLLYPDGRVMLADFGIARVQDAYKGHEQSSLTVAGAFLGTPAYISPELALGQAIDYRSDIYQLGVILFQMLAGHVPFDGETYYAVVQKHIFEPLPLLHALNPVIPPAVDAVLQKATAKKPGERYGSAGAFVQAFREAYSQQAYSVVSAVPQGQQGQAIDILSTSPVIPLQIHEVATNPLPPLSSNGYQQFSTPGFTNQNGPLTPHQPIPFSKLLSRFPWLKVAALMTIVLMALLIVWQVTTVFSNRVPITEPAKIVVQQYYDRLNRQRYLEAYALLSPDFQRSIPFPRFALGYANVKHSAITVERVEEKSPEQVVVTVTIQAEEVVDSKVVTKRYRWSGTVIKQANDAWKINSATIAPL